MAVSCEPQDLADASTCFQCLSPTQRQNVSLYLLREIAGLSDSTPEQLATLAKCFECIPTNMRLPVQAYLLCQNANGGAAPVECAMLTGDGDPTGVETPDFEGQLYHDTTGDTWWYSTGTTSADWTQIPTSGGPCENVEGVGAPT